MNKRFSCTEPQNNMYISRDGSVKACCHNHYYEIGNLHNNTLVEIWNSDKRKEFAKLLYKSSNEPSCGNCALKQPELKNGLLFNKKLKSTRYPLSIEFELSNKCNLECSMCSPMFSNQIAKRYPEHNNYIFDFKSITEQLAPLIMHLKEAKFYGGEPFIIDQYFDIWEYIIKNNPGCKFYIQTNGTILNEKIKSILQKGYFNIGVSLESVNDDTYKSIRINADLPKVLDNIEYFQNYCLHKKTFFGVAICPIRNNWKELPVLTEYFNNKGIHINFHQVVRPFNVSLWNLPKDELSIIYRTLKDVSFTSRPNQVVKQNIKQYQNLLNQIADWCKSAENRENTLTTFNFQTENEVIEILLKNASEFLDSLQWLNKTSKENKLDIFSKKLLQVCESIADKKLLLTQLSKLTLSPIYLVLSEIEVISIQEITENILAL